MRRARARGSSGPVARRTVLVGTIVLLLGCLESEGGSDDSESDGPGPNGTGADEGFEDGVDATDEVGQLGDLELTSPAFDHGERIPEEYGYEAANVNPPLEIDGVPADADALALIVDDPDAVEPAGFRTPISVQALRAGGESRGIAGSPVRRTRRRDGRENSRGDPIRRGVSGVSRAEYSSTSV